MCKLCWAPCVNERLKRVTSLSNGESTDLDRNEELYGIELWQRIDVADNIWVLENPGPQPWVGRATLDDINWLQLHLRIIQAVAVAPRANYYRAQRVVAIIDFIHSCLVANEEDAQLLSDGASRSTNGNTRPQLLAPVDSTTLDEENQTCICCTEKFGVRPAEGGDAESAVRFPCHASHVVGSECVKTMVKERGYKCPWCNTTFDPQDYEAELRQYESPWWMYIIREE